MKVLRRSLAALLCVLMLFSMTGMALEDNTTTDVASETHVHEEAAPEATPDVADEPAEPEATEAPVDDVMPMSETGDDGIATIAEDGTPTPEATEEPSPEPTTEPTEEPSGDPTTDPGATTEPGPEASTGPETSTEPAPETKTVALKYLDPSTFTITDSSRIFADGEADYDSVTLNAEGKISGEIPAAPTVTGWEFVGWYTAPVKYAFWGDKTTTPYNSYEEIPAGFQNDVDGKPYDYKAQPGSTDVSGSGDWSQTLTSYWIWLSTLNGDGKKVTAETTLEDGATIYALYKPTTVTYKLHYQGWNRTSGVITCTRQYGTPFGNETLSGGSGYTFGGWYDAIVDGTQQTFYSTPTAGADYYAHWKSNDGTVTQANYNTAGYEPVTGLTLRNEKGNDLGDTLSIPDAWKSEKITVSLTPSTCGVTDVKWEILDASGKVLASTEKPSSGGTITTDALDILFTGGLSATVTPKTRGTATTIKVSTLDGKNISDSVKVDTTGHSFDKVEVVQRGNCAVPTITLCTCVHCGKTEQRKTYANHRWAYRDVPATCTTDHVWVHYCKVCGQDDPNEATRTKFLSPAKGHQFTITQTTGCGGTVTTKTCTVCGYVEVTNDGVGVHEWGDYTTDKLPTCTENGLQSIHCTKCGVVKPDSQQEIPSTGHRTHVVVTAASCTTPGISKSECLVCGETWEEVTHDALGHDMQVETVSGCSGDIVIKTCKACGYQEIEGDLSQGHSWATEYTVDVEPNCLHEGSKSIHCTNCAATKDSQSIPTTTDHEWSTEPELIEMSADGTSITYRYICTVCGESEIKTVRVKVVQNDNGEQEVQLDVDLRVDTTDNLPAATDGSIASTTKVTDKTAADTTLTDSVKSLLGENATGAMAQTVKDAAGAGKSISVEVERKQATVSETNKAEFAKLFTEEATYEFIDISVVVKAAGQQIGTLSEIDAPITFAVAKPAGRIVTVLHEHNGEIKPIDFTIDGDTIYFSTDKFSTFAVAATNDIAFATVNAIPAQTYTGSAIKPAVQVTVNGDEVLTEGVDYTLSYKNNVEAGTATVVITGMGDFEGTVKEVNFAVEKPAASGNDASYASPATGDMSNVWLWFGLLAASALALVCLFAVAFKRRNAMK